jgi:hypothetical protein
MKYCMSETYVIYVITTGTVPVPINVSGDICHLCHHHGKNSIIFLLSEKEVCVRVHALCVCACMCVCHT